MRICKSPLDLAILMSQSDFTSSSFLTLACGNALYSAFKVQMGRLCGQSLVIRSHFVNVLSSTRWWQLLKQKEGTLRRKGCSPNPQTYNKYEPCYKMGNHNLPDIMRIQKRNIPYTTSKLLNSWLLAQRTAHVKSFNWLIADISLNKSGRLVIKTKSHLFWNPSKLQSYSWDIY